MVNDPRPLFPYSFSLNFPDRHSNELEREHIISTISKQFANGKNIICLEGEEGIGKSTILKQFALAHPHNTFSTFINPVRGLASPEDFVLHDLYDQFNWFVEKRDRTVNLNIDEEKYLQMLYRVKREQKNYKNISFFIVDGLEYVDNPYVLKKIIRLLPLGEPGIKILFSTDLSKIEALIPNHSTISLYNLPLFPFTLAETDKVFNSELKINSEELKQLWEAANKGIPGKLRDIFRILIENSFSVGQVMDDIDKISFIYELDWNRLQAINDDLLNRIVAFIALDDKVYTKTSLSKVLDVKEQDLIQRIKKISFISVLSNDEIQFTSNANRLFFGKKLTDYKKLVVSENIKYLLKNQDSLEALIGLPKYYSSSSDYDGVLNILTVDYFPKLIKTSQTLTSASVSVNLGYLAAKKSGADQKLLDFSLYGSLLNSVEGLHVWDSEIEARIEMGDYDNAIKLANSALLHEDRLILLARIAKIKKKKKEAIEDSLQEQINHLYKQIDIKNLGDRAIRIASDLFYFNPSLALSLIEGTSHKNNQNLNDWLLSKITLAALESKQAVDNEKMSRLIDGQQAKEFSSSLSELFGSYSFEEIVKETSKLSRPKEKVLLLRFWIINNKKDQNLGKAICLALDAMIENNSKEFADASLLADLVEESHSVTSKEEKQNIINKIDQFRGEAKKLSYSVDYFKFMTYAIRARITIEHDWAMGWFYDLKKELDTMSDKVIQAECLAILNNCLHEIEDKVDRKRHGFLFDTLNSQLKNLVIRICDISAYHYDNLRDVVWHLAKYDWGFALEIALKANTTDRRDSLLYRAFEGYVEFHVVNLKVENLTKIYDSVNDNLVKEACIRSLLENLYSKKLSANEKLVSFILKSLYQVKSLPLQSYLLCLMAIFLNKDKEKNASTIKSLYTEIEKYWSALDSEVAKIEIGFLICSMLSDSDKDISREYLKRADDLKKTIWPDSLNTINIYSLYAKLLIRSFGGLIKAQSYDESSISKLTEVINAVPSPITRIYLWNYLATIADVDGDLNLRTKTFNEFIKPTYEALADKNEQNHILIDLAYQFFIHNSISTIKRIEGLSKAQREDSLMNIIYYTLYQSIPSEPYESDDETLSDRLSFDNLNEICELLWSLEIDVNLYLCIESVVKAAIKLKATPIQREVLHGKLLEIINKKLPNKDYIRHPGYKIISLAQILKLEKDTKKHSTQLDALLDAIDKQVPNLSDKAFMYATMIDIVPQLKGIKHSQSSFISKSLAIIDQLEFSFESAYRTEFLLKKLRETNPNLWKERLTKEFKKTINSYHNKEAIELQRRLIDHAYRYDSSFAKTLMNLLDDEEVRMEYRRKKHLKSFFESLDLKKQIAEDKIAGDKASSKMFANACQSSLASLNSKQIAPKKYSQIRGFLDFSIRLSTQEAYPIYCYYVQNVIRKQEGSAEAVGTFTQMVDSFYRVCKFIEVIVQRYKSEVELDYNRIDLSESRKKLFKAGERDAAFRFIKNWLSVGGISYIKICDPYFNVDDLGFLKIVLEAVGKVEVSILTSPEGRGNDDSDLYRKYLYAWQEASIQDPPTTKVSVVRFKRTGKSPFHDRWILTDKVGLHLGTSFNGLGVSKSSQITELELGEKLTVEKEVFDSLFDGRREFNGEKTECMSFVLS